MYTNFTIKEVDNCVGSNWYTLHQREHSHFIPVKIWPQKTSGLSGYIYVLYIFYANIYISNGCLGVKDQYCTDWSYFSMNPVCFFIQYFLGYILKSVVFPMTFFSEENVSRYNMNNLLWNNRFHRKGQNVE